jgi:hypothetical protein
MKKFDILANKILREMAYGLGGSGQELTKDELIKYVIELDKIGRGVMPVSFTSVTVPTYRKTGFPYKTLFKVGQTSGMIGTDYESNVNKQREREGVEGEFVAQANKNIRERLSPSVGITTKGLPVLVYRPTNKPLPSFWFVETQDGQIQEVEKEQIKPFLPAPSPSMSQGVEKTIDYRTYGFDKIVGISIDGKEHIVSDVNPIAKQIFEKVKDRLRS